jgi:hypothetical protein
MAQHGVRSLYCYNLLGSYDLLVRAWVPQTLHVDEFREVLLEEIPTYQPQPPVGNYPRIHTFAVAFETPFAFDLDALKVDAYTTMRTSLELSGSISLGTRNRRPLRRRHSMNTTSVTSGISSHPIPTASTSSLPSQ